MALTITQLFTPLQLPASTEVLYTVPSSPPTTVLKNGRIRLTNTDGAAISVTLYAAAAAVPSNAASCFVSADAILGNSSVEIDLPTMRAGDTLRGFAGTASAITMHEIGGTLYS